MSHGVTFTVHLTVTVPFYSYRVNRLSGLSVRNAAVVSGSCECGHWTDTSSGVTEDKEGRNHDGRDLFKHIGL